jgi:hypothetical protein
LRSLIRVFVIAHRQRNDVTLRSRHDDHTEACTLSAGLPRAPQGVLEAGAGASRSEALSRHVGAPLNLMPQDGRARSRLPRLAPPRG